MREDRLEKLAIYLRFDVPSEHFDMHCWGQKGFEARGCGTAACALGWATVCFPGEGLRMEYGWLGMGTPTYEGQSGFDAAASFLEIPFDHAVRLFSTPGSPDEVGRRLLDYLRDATGTTAA